MNSSEMFFTPFFNGDFVPNTPINAALQGKIYADVPLNYFNNVNELKEYVLELKALGVNVLLILPHFLPALSPYVVKDYEEPCALFKTWQCFADFMLFVKEQGLDRMIDIPLNHADWQANHLKREWYINYENNGIEAGCEDEDADRNLVHINWGAFLLDNSNPQLINYWLENVIFKHIEKYHVNAIRIDAAWGLNEEGLKRLVGETKKRFENVWFLAENLGMKKLIKLAQSSIEAGADRFFNNIYWHNGGLAVPADIYRFYKRSKGLPTCSIFSSHDTLMPAMKAAAKIKSAEVEGLNDKGIVRYFQDYNNCRSLSCFSEEMQNNIIKRLKLDFVFPALMSTDLMFAAGSEKLLFERYNVCSSAPESFNKGINSDLPAFISEILKLKASDKIFNSEGIVVPFGAWQNESTGLKGFVKTTKENEQLLVAANTADYELGLGLPNRIKKCTSGTVYLPDKSYNVNIAAFNGGFSLKPAQILILKAR